MPQQTCYWCAEAKGADREQHNDYSVCEECHNDITHKDMVIVFAFTPKPEIDNQMPFCEGCYPTGEAVSVTVEGVRTIFPHLLAGVIEKKHQFIALPDYRYDAIFNQFLDASSVAH